MWSYDVWSALDVQIIKSCGRMPRISPATWTIDFAWVDEWEHNKMQKRKENKLNLVL